jgi:arylsulfatase A-like enzyme
MNRLDEMGEMEDTLVVFLADHGEMLGDRYHRFSKYALYEGAVRVPLILAGAGVPPEKHGTVDDRYAELVDVLPTLLQATGQPVPPELPGSSLLAPPCRRGGFAEMHGSGYEPAQMAPTYMWRTREYKLILHLPGEAVGAQLRLDEVQGELYDLQKDPHEWDNLYDDPAHLATRERLTRDLLLHLACAWARYPMQATCSPLVREEKSEE